MTPQISGMPAGWTADRQCRGRAGLARARPGSTPLRRIPCPVDLAQSIPGRSMGAGRPDDGGRTHELGLIEQLGALPAGPHRRRPGGAVSRRSQEPYPRQRVRTGSCRLTPDRVRAYDLIGPEAQRTAARSGQVPQGRSRAWDTPSGSSVRWSGRSPRDLGPESAKTPASGGGRESNPPGRLHALLDFDPPGSRWKALSVPESRGTLVLAPSRALFGYEGSEPSRDR